MCDDGWVSETTNTDLDSCSPPPADGWVALTAAGRAVARAVGHDPAGTLLASDVDGTLSPIVADPTRAAVSERARRALAGLDGRVGTLAVITGRPVARAREMVDIDRRGGLDHLVMLGLYGVERYDVGTGQLQVPEPPAVMGQARHRLQEAVDRAVAADPAMAGTMVEDKGSAVVLHTRRAVEHDRALALLGPVARDLAEELGLALEEGRDVVELKAWQTTKGDALRRLIAERMPSVLLMCGDDLGDLPAMAVVEEWIGEGRPGARVVSWSAEQPRVARSADVLCDGPEGVAAFLDEISGRITESSTM